MVIVRVVQVQTRADQPRRSRDTAAVSPTPVDWDDSTFFTTLLLSTSRRRVNPALVGVARVGGSGSEQLKGKNLKNDSWSPVLQQLQQPLLSLDGSDVYV